MAKGGLKPVQFGFNDSLAAARALWALADSIDAAATRRVAAAESALRSWTGAFRDQFATKVTDELSTASGASQEIRNGAMTWAQAWKNAMDEENRRRRARAVTALTKKLRNERSGWEQVDDWFGGDDSDKVAEKRTRRASTYATPQPPNFAPTGSLENF
ncbi:MAG: hypothetical protein ACOYN3_08805 [Acidimicrobiia bacterium]